MKLCGLMVPMLAGCALAARWESARQPRLAGFILAALIVAPSARADPIILVCYGEMRTLGLAGIGETPEKYSLPIVIDQQAKTIAVGDYEPLPFSTDPQDNKIGFTAKPGSNYGVSTGILDRITGAASIHFLPRDGGVIWFEGICKRSKTLF